MIYDAIIIGKGPAGISAAIYLHRAGKNVLVIGNSIGALEKAHKIDNYYGFNEIISGKELFENGIKQATRLGIKIKTDEVVNLGFGNEWNVKTANEEFFSKAVLFATGKSRTGLRVSGFEEFRGKGISFCATCDGFFYKEKAIGVIGSGDYAASELNELLQFTKNIVLFTNGESEISKNFPENIKIENGKIKEFLGEKKSGSEEKVLSKIEVEGEKVYEVDGIFVAIGTAGAVDFASKIGVELNKTDIVVDKNFMTNIPGIFAAGDCIGGFLQVAKAVSDGANAGRAMISWLKNA